MSKYIIVAEIEFADEREQDIYVQRMGLRTLESEMCGFNDKITQYGCMNAESPKVQGLREVMAKSGWIGNPDRFRSRTGLKDPEVEV